MQLRRNAIGRRRRITMERLEERTVLNAPNLTGPGFYYDADAMEAFIVGTDLNDRFLLAADPDGTIRVTHNGKPLPAIDPATNLPSQVDPAVWNTDSILALLRQGDDVFDFFSDRFAELGAVGKWDEAAVEVSGDEGNDTLILRVVEGPQPEPPTFPLSVEFDGGAGSADTFRMVGASANEKVDIFSMDDFHNVTLSYNPIYMNVAALATERLHADLGRGDDVLNAHIEDVEAAGGGGGTGIVQIEYGFHLGDGDDAVNARMELFEATGGGGGTIVASHFRFDLGAGDDMFELFGIVEQAMGFAGGPRSVEVSAGAGNDLLAFDLSQLGHTPVDLAVAAGAGDDSVAVIMPCNFDVGLDLGFGDDLLELSGQVETGRLRARAGGGNDRIDGFLEAVGLIAVPKVAMSFDLQDGDDTFDITAAVRIGAAGQGRVQIDVAGSGGNDTMDTQLSISGAGPLGSQPMPVVIGFVGGSGHDEVFAKVEPPPPSPGIGPDVQLTAVLGTGNDTFDLVSDATGGGGGTLRIDAGAGDDVVDFVGSFHWNVWINLGSGHDTAAVRLTTSDSVPPPQGAPTLLNVTLNGGFGNDALEVWLDLPLEIALAGSVRVLGSAGNDELALFADGNTSLLSLLIDGGLGKDTCEKRGKVTVRSASP